MLSRPSTQPPKLRMCKTAQAAATSPDTPQTATAPAEAKPPVKTSLFGSSTPAKTEETQQVASAATAAAPPVRTSLFGSLTQSGTCSGNRQGAAACSDMPIRPTKIAKPQPPKRPILPLPAKARAAVTKTEATRPPTSAKNNGALMRLFSNNQSKPAGKRQVAVIEPKSQPQSSRCQHTGSDSIGTSRRELIRRPDPVCIILAPWRAAQCGHPDHAARQPL